MSWDTIGNISSIATLTLFVFYFIGRWINMSRSMQITFEDIYLCYDDKSFEDAISKSCGIAEEFSFKKPTSDNNVRVVLITSRPIFDIGVHKVIYDDETLSTYRIDADPLYNSILSSRVISPGMAVVFDFEWLPDIYASYQLQYKRFDYMQCCFDFIANLHGGLSSQVIKTTYTRQGIIRNFVA